MAIPLLAFMGLGFGGKTLFDEYNGIQAKRYGGRVSELIGQPPSELMGPSEAQSQGQPLMSPGTGLMGGEINPMQFAGELTSMPRKYQTAGLAMLRDQMMPRNRPPMQTIQSGAGPGGKMNQTMRLGPDGRAYPIPGVLPRAPGSAVTINNAPKLPTGKQWVDPNDLNKGVEDIKGMEEASPGNAVEKTAAGFLSRQLAASRGMSALMANEIDEPDFGLIDVISGKAELGDVLGDTVNPTGVQMAAGRMGPGWLESTILNPQQQQYLQYARDWIRAKLRKESGAVINKDEWADEYQTFFPMPNDSKETLAQKREARQVSEESMRTMAGVAAPTRRMPGDLWMENGRKHRMTSDGTIQREKLK